MMRGGGGKSGMTEVDAAAVVEVMVVSFRMKIIDEVQSNSVNPKSCFFLRDGAFHVQGFGVGE